MLSFSNQLPNVLGFLFGVAQMVLYVMYKGAKKLMLEQKLPEQVTDICLSTLETPEVRPIEKEAARVESNESNV